MKTAVLYLISSITKVSLWAVVLVLTACGVKENAQGQSAKAPAIDLHTAVITDNLEAVKQHIAAGSDLNVKDPFGGSSPLISAAVFGKTEMAKVLLDAGVDINFQNNDGSTALHTAAFFCRPEIVKLLLAKKADKSIKNKYGATAYDNVAGSFSELKDVYDIMKNTLGPMGLKLDYAYLEKTRPEIAAMLK
ncbi:MAG: ankyrin repeat domain-containing protein [Cyclobacteriaceae bacterium]|nr:ankyrin repeat domain-containing protein [Cyclobacteriaceae bacterium]UYN86598.1 MAG: ankyrin repeat domain-containing protein [Cyclobacteriaceae bacterium]